MPKKRKEVNGKIGMIRYPSEFPKTQKPLSQMSLYKVIKFSVKKGIC